jgi:hypothetical protein
MIVFQSRRVATCRVPPCHGHRISQNLAPDLSAGGWGWRCAGAGVAWPPRPDAQGGLQWLYASGQLAFIPSHPPMPLWVWQTTTHALDKEEDDSLMRVDVDGLQDDLKAEADAAAPFPASAPYPAPDYRGSWADRRDTSDDERKYRLWNQAQLGK